MTPTDPRRSTTLAGWVSTSRANSAMRASTSTRRTRAWPGSITYLGGFWSTPTGCLAGVMVRSTSSTTPLEWDSRVVVRRKHGVSKRSDSSNAARVNARASAGVDGSNIGSLAAMA